MHKKRCWMAVTIFMLLIDLLKKSSIYTCNYIDAMYKKILKFQKRKYMDFFLNISLIVKNHF